MHHEDAIPSQQSTNTSKQRITVLTGKESTVIERYFNSRQIKILEAFYTHNNDNAKNRDAIVPTAYIPLIYNKNDERN